MNKIRGLQIPPEVFDPLGRADVARVRELVTWLRVRSEEMPPRDSDLRAAFEVLIERSLPGWIGAAKGIKRFATVPFGIVLEPYIGWPRGSETVQFNVR